MQKTLKTLAVLVLPVLFCADVQGAGFALYEYSARTTAMGGATMANKAEAASLAVNPALITELEGTQAQVGLTIVTADAKTSVAGSARTLKNDVWYLPNFFITRKWSDQVSFGLGGYSRYGLGGQYNGPVQTWPGSNLAYKVSVETFSFTPTIAVKANDELSVAMGLEAMIIGFSQNSFSTPARGPYEVSGSGVSWGGNFSLIYKPLWAEKWAFGAMYRSKVKQNLNGRINAGNMTIPDPINIHSGDAEGAIALPDSISAGISYQATDKWVLEAGIVGTFWSSYDQILIQYKDNSANPFVYNNKNYKDVYRLNFGTEYQLNKNWALRAGYVFDKSPINSKEMDTLVPVDDRHIASVGVGYAQDNWTLDFAYAHVFAKDLSGISGQMSSVMGTPISVKYTDGKSDMFSLTFGYKF